MQVFVGAPSVLQPQGFGFGVAVGHHIHGACITGLPLHHVLGGVAEFVEILVVAKTDFVLAAHAIRAINGLGVEVGPTRARHVTHRTRFGSDVIHRAAIAVQITGGSLQVFVVVNIGQTQFIVPGALGVGLQSHAMHVMFLAQAVNTAGQCGATGSRAIGGGAKAAIAHIALGFGIGVGHENTRRQSQLGGAVQIKRQFQVQVVADPMQDAIGPAVIGGGPGGGFVDELVGAQARRGGGPE